VYWTIDKKYTVVPINNIQCDKELIEEEKEYEVLFNSKSYQATVMAIGSIEHCKSEQELRIENLNREKKLKGTSNENNNNKTNSSIKISSLTETENELLKEKIVELENAVEDYKSRYEKVNSELIDHKTKINALYTQDDIDKLVVLSKNVLELYDSSYNSKKVLDDDANKSILCTEYPSIKIDSICLKELMEKLQNKTTTSSAAFRILVGILLPDIEIWCGKDVTGNTIYKLYKEQIGASIEFINKYNNDFSFAIAKRILSQLCCEARRKSKYSNKLEDSDSDIEEIKDELNETESDNRDLYLDDSDN
jgi:hypothetical protein